MRNIVRCCFRWLGVGVTKFDAEGGLFVQWYGRRHDCKLERSLEVALLVGARSVKNTTKCSNRASSIAFPSLVSNSTT
jgi:hypothetical protein